MIRVLRAADRIATPWKNGGGLTREVAIWPPGSGMDEFEWRVSIAEVREAGPFSLFEGIDRTLMILRGRLSLTFADRVVELAPDSAPFAFRGDAPCTGRPIGGAATDLNVMVRRGRGTAHAGRFAQGAICLTAKTTLIIACVPTSLGLGDRELSLQPFDAVLVEQPCEREVALAGDVFAIGIVQPSR